MKRIYLAILWPGALELVRFGHASQLYGFLFLLGCCGIAVEVAYQLPVTIRDRRKWRLNKALAQQIAHSWSFPYTPAILDQVEVSAREQERAITAFYDSPLIHNA